MAPFSLTRGDEEQAKQLHKNSHLEVVIPDSTGLSRAHPTNWNQLWKSFDEYYMENEKAIMEASQLDLVEMTSSNKAIRKEAIVTSFLEHSKTILHGLQFLSEIHPAISVVVGAFSAVIKIELIRRDNNMKAMSVKIQMQNLMCALFQFRLLRTEEHDYMTSQRAASTMSAIAQEITACGSDLSYYQDKKLLSRLLHAQFFEQRLAQHIATFDERRSELLLLFTAHTAGQVQETKTIASRIEGKIDNLANLLRRLDSSREKEANTFIKNNGGIEHCIGDKALLSELVSKTGDSILEEGNVHERGSDASTRDLMKLLQKELKEDMAEALKKNTANFEAMLRVQNNNLQHMSHLIENQTSHLMKIHHEIAMISPGIRKHVFLTDPVLKTIWTEMGLRQSVKAKKFVLTFKDYYTRTAPKTPIIMTATPNTPVYELPPSASLDTSNPGEEASFTTGGEGEKGEVDGDWLRYLDVAHLDPIVEAIDDDLSGFISMHEANKFAGARPKHWSLLRWFAYWAAGWALSIQRYKEKILDMVQQLYTARLNVLPCNLALINDYLDGSVFDSLDMLLRSTQPFAGGHDLTDTKLASLVSESDEELEGRLLPNLKDLEFKLFSVDRVTLVTGAGRMERYALPLIYLVLRHHVSLVSLASHYRFHSFEMYSATVSLSMIFDSLQARAQTLKGLDLSTIPLIANAYPNVYPAIFRQKSRPIQDQFKKFSFGMLESFGSLADSEYQYADSTLLQSYWESSGATESFSMDESCGPVSPSGLTCVSRPTTTDLEALKMLWRELDNPEERPEILEQVLVHDFTSPIPMNGNQQRGIAGGWTIRLHRNRGLAVMQRDLFVIRFAEPGPMGAELIGAGELHNGPQQITGTIERRTQHSDEERGEDDSQELNEHGQIEIAALDFTVPWTDGSAIHCRLTPVDGSDGAHWEGEWWYDGDEDDEGVRACDMFRAPPEALRYHDALKEALCFQKDSGTTIRTQATPKSPNQPVTSTSEAEVGEPFSQRPPPPSDANNCRDAAIARWNYARDVTLYQVREKLHSKAFYRERAKERRRYILLTMKMWNDVQTDEEFCELLKIRARVHPNIIYVWNTIANYYFDRKVPQHVSSYVLCDYCRASCSFTRHFCITCQLPSFNNQVDLCAGCLKKNVPITTKECKFTHTTSHTIFKSNKRILDMEKSHLVPQARIRSKRVKQLFRGENVEKRHHEKRQEAPKPPAPPCSHCEKEISLPCWVCTVCAGDTYICMDCESGLAHNQDHSILRIFDDTEEEDAVTSEAERYYNRAKVALAEELGTLETKFDQRMETLAAQVDKIQGLVVPVAPAVTASQTGVSAIASAVPGEQDAEVKGVEQVNGARGDNFSELSGRMDKLETRFTALEGMLLRVLEAVETR